MNAERNHVAVIGGGVAGLTAADELAGWGIAVSLFEQAPSLGGHAIQLGCKATDACVKCGACVAQDKLLRATRRANVNIHTNTTIEAISGQAPYQIRYGSHSSAEARPGEIHADAILVATGFAPYDPSDKPYGYGQFQNVITSLGPSLSVSTPMTIPNKPCTIIDREKAPESMALVQPNSFSNGLKKTPKDKYAPHIATMMHREAATIT